MDLLLKILKVSALLLFLFVLVVLCAPSLKGPFVIIHFATTLKAWLLVQMVFFGFLLAAHLLSGRVVAPLTIPRGDRVLHPLLLRPALAPLRC
jgi:hypothetical protein